MRKVMLYLGIMMLVASCSNSSNGVRVVVLNDITEADFVARPKPKKVIKQFGLESDKWKSVLFRYSTISDISVNKEYQKSLQGEHSLLANELQRKKVVSEFVKEIDSVLSDSQYTSPRNYSSIWKPLVKEMVELQQDTITPTKILLYSDLRENSRIWSSYRTKDIHRYTNDFDGVKQLFLSQAKTLKKGTRNIKIIVIYQPRTPTQDTHYQRMVRLYKALFSEFDISIEFVANL